MIKVDRVDKPAVLKKNQQKWKQNYLSLIQLYQQNPISNHKKKKETAEIKYRHKQVKDSLTKMFNDKCAYCESHISHVDYGHIEHFKPKSKYPESCFDWDNLLLSCGICNGAQYKGDNFPLDVEGGPLVNPTLENPNDFFNFEFDIKTGTANIIPLNERGIITETTLGLNRPKLVKHRSRVISMIAFISKLADEGDVDCKQKILSYCSVDSEYSAFTLSMAKKINLI